MYAFYKSLLIFKKLLSETDGDFIEPDSMYSRRYSQYVLWHFVRVFPCNRFSLHASFPGGVGRVPDGEEGGELLDEGVALQIALVVLCALKHNSHV